LRPTDLWKSFSGAPAAEQLAGKLAGTPILLSQVVREATSRSEQTARIAAYWELSAAVTDYNLALREETELQALRQGVSRPSFAWDEARLALASRVEAARTEAEAAQNRLQRLLRRPAEGELPLPANSPHCGAYATRYEENFAGRESTEALQLSELLPQLHQQLRNQAAGVAADGQWLQTVSQQRDPESDGTVLLKTYELLSLRRQEFLQTVRDYNTQIARYSELAAPGQVGADRLVGMLIETTPTDGKADDKSAITRTSAEQPVTNQSTAPRTFVEDEPPAARSEPPTKEGEERSILVRPQ
jgi:hypothetical protein